ncbi:hypothetical protein MH215_04760 [Paenibacillus sp. ACRSA]|uniref:hypothetical protein n=1 Tax=Paenibacillus sp. ACRSA TaxID=2918211 RepID=UPI001EF414F1|nr:hypothetical protein [Paenibacillus sp. ACRSA]MCG7376292.1 hypothetical protein [Paenibacillus sp. ACRSA]
MKKLCLLVLLLLSGLAVTACNGPQVEKLTTQTIQQFYPGDMENVDSIEITDGSSGVRKVFSNKKQIQEWINQVKNLTFVPDSNQEDRSGFLYAVSLLENNQIKLGFTPNSQGGHYYIHNEELTTQIQRLLENENLTKNDQ